MTASSTPYPDAQPQGGNLGPTTSPPMEIERFRNHVFHENAGQSANTRLSNWDAYLYAEIADAINRMSRLSEDDELFLDKEVARRALTVLGFLKDHAAINPPKILNHGGEALAFTWMIQGIKRYLTVADDEVDLMSLSPDLLPQEEVLSQGSGIPYPEILKKLRSAPISNRTALI